MQWRQKLCKIIAEPCLKSIPKDSNTDLLAWDHIFTPEKEEEIFPDLGMQCANSFAAVKA